VAALQGFEYAWAREKQPGLRPLALAINVHRYPTAHVVVKRDNPVKDIAGLKGQSLTVPSSSPGLVYLFLERKAGAKLDDFFAKVARPDNIEDALDDVVDGIIQVAATDRAALETLKRRKPARFAQLREVAHSQPFPPPVIVYQDKTLDDATLRQFREGLLGAGRKEKGQTMLTLFRLTGFEAVPADFDKILADTRKAYPPSP